MLISVALSLAVAFMSVLPLIHETHGDTPLKKAIVAVCCLSSLAHLFQTSFDGISHEINPQHYRWTHDWSNELKIKSLRDSTLQSALFAGLCVPLIAVFVSTEWRDNLICFGTACCITFYLQFFDFTLRIFLCSTPDIQKVVEESLSDESVEVYLEVVLQSVCHSNSKLVKRLSNVSDSTACSDLEREEQKRNELSITEMANTLLYKTIQDEGGPHLEDDILRLAILTSIGLQGEEGKVFDEPYNVPLCRGLCAYFGGIGEALILITTKKQDLVGQWLLPPGAVVMTECAVGIATSCLCSAISKNPTTWRNTHLATLVPTLLNSYHRLETGMLNHAQSLSGIRASFVEEADKISLFRQSCPHLLSLYATINKSVGILLQKALNGSRRADVLASCDQEMLKWCEVKQNLFENWQ